MNNYLKLTIDFAGILISLTSFVLLVVDQKYVSAILVFIVFIIILVFALREIFSFPLSFDKIILSYKFLDKHGKKVSLKKEKIFKVKEKNVTTIVDRNFSASGTLEFIRTNIGKMIDIIDEGGTQTVYTSFKTPLAKGEIINHSLDIVFNNSYTNTNESITNIVTYKANQIIFNLTFPKERRPIDLKAYVARGEKIERITDPAKSNNSSSFHLSISKPKVGTKYIIEWEW